MTASDSRLELDGITKVFDGPSPVTALGGVTLTIDPGEYVAIVGASGSGKSTLLNLLALLDTPTAGRYAIGGRDTAGLNERESTELRAQTFGFVFQDFHLLERRSVLANVQLGSLYRALPDSVTRPAALAALERVGLSHKADQQVATLSGGERQRVAIARAIAIGTPVLVADEPTGNLDSANTAIVVDALRQLHQDGTTIILVTHEDDVAASADRVITMRDGLVVGDQSAATTPWAHGATEEIPVVPRTTRGRRMAQRFSRLRARDLFADAGASLVSRPGRSAGLLAAVAVGVGLAVATMGLSDSARAQVSDAFDAHLNRIVTLEPSQTGHLPDMTKPATLERLTSLSGVDAAGIITGADSSATASASAAGRGESAQILGLTPQAPAAADLTIDWADPDHRLDDGQVLLGSKLAGQLELGPLAAGPAVWLDGRAHPVAGVITSAPRTPDVLSAISMTASDAATRAPAAYLTAHLIVAPGAAPQVARQAPLALNPWDPEGVTVSAPPDPATLRQQVEGEVRTMLFVLTGVAALAATISLANSMMTSVGARTGEIGLRRAIGARRRHIKALVLTEAVGYGLAGGAIGLILGIVSLLAISIARGWAPVFNPVIAPVAVLAGAAVGALAGLAAAIRASRIQPSQALRA